MSDAWFIVGWIGREDKIEQHDPRLRDHVFLSLWEAWGSIPIPTRGLVRHGGEFWVVDGRAPDTAVKFASEDVAWMAARMLE